MNEQILIFLDEFDVLKRSWKSPRYLTDTYATFLFFFLFSQVSQKCQVSLG